MYFTTCFAFLCTGLSGRSELCSALNFNTYLQDVETRILLDEASMERHRRQGCIAAGFEDLSSPICHLEDTTGQHHYMLQAENSPVESNSFLSTHQSNCLVENILI